MQQCGNAVTLAAGIDHQDHRGAKQSSDVRGGPRCGRAPGRPNAPVEQPQHPFDHGDVRARNSMRVQGADKPLPHQYRVEIAAGPSRGQGVIAGVDKIRAYLKRRDGVTGLPQRSDQARRDRGLTAARRRRGDGHRGYPHHHSMPFFPLRPASIGCFTLVISVTRSAAATNRWGASRPVITTC